LDQLDKALEILKNYGPEFGGGLSNHGPMVAEALFTLKRYDDIIPWVENYKINLEEHPKTKEAITVNNFSEELSNYHRIGDWIAFFDSQLKSMEWTMVLTDWLPELIPGLLAGATHGLIRTAHAIRSFKRSESQQRIHELAEGMGYWAARYRTLPTKDTKSEGLLPSEAIKKVKLLPENMRVHAGYIIDGFKPLEKFPDFAEVINYIDVSIDPSFIISNLTETFAQVYLANAGNVKLIVTFIHGVTAISALRFLIPYLAPRVINKALKYAWQAGAAIYSAWGKTYRAKIKEDEVSSLKELIDGAVVTKNVHAIKFTEACIREYILNPKNIYFIVAEHAIKNLK